MSIILEASVAAMVRKQIYIHRRQQDLLDQLARARGVSQAEIVRLAIEREAAGDPSRPAPSDHGAWEEVLDTVGARAARHAGGAAYRWNREDAYQEREIRSDQPRDPELR